MADVVIRISWATMINPEMLFDLILHILSIIPLNLPVDAYTSLLDITLVAKFIYILFIQKPTASNNMGSSPVYDPRDDGVREFESGYVSGSSSQADLPDIYFTKPHLAFLNRQLQHLEPQGMTHNPHM